MPLVLVRPLEPRGEQRFHANVTLELRTTIGFVAFEFRVDTGAELSVLGLEEAEAAGLPVPDESEEITRQINGRDERVRFGTLGVRFRIERDTVGTHAGAQWHLCATLPSKPVVCEFAWDCMFVVGRPRGAPRILGLGGHALSEVDWRFRGTHRGFPFGTVEFELYPQPEPTVPPTQV
jgi:hypothetical protein